jgi:hypothetical protein
MIGYILQDLLVSVEKWSCQPVLQSLPLQRVMMIAV